MLTKVKKDTRRSVEPQHMAIRYRVKKRSNASDSSGAFSTRNVPSGGTVVTISKNAYADAKRAAANKLKERSINVREKPSI